ncbi:hypothetical protein LK996_08485 [Lysobacter sp. A6]|uniref:Carboxypeptidase regulatory-like domain-containing protein n=1 Tax=Noviluteimonas lactosilytica TaxID=2888523 RepID=A0ABS8JHM8_9GAMM|nr:hypothetical protein [Lysobacter lactosilyticus]MCC8363110.1 hypothetical protein [Lysobacter lactosilyticus]
MRKTFAIAGLALVLASCGDKPQPPSAPRANAPTAPATDVDASRAWLVRALTCGDRAFLLTDVKEQRARLGHLAGTTCEPASTGTPLRCAITPSLRIGQADIAWFVVGGPSQDLATIILPAPPEALRTSISAGAGALSPSTDLGDTTLQCALTDNALAPGAIAGTVKRDGDPSASVRVCAFELAEGMPTCIRTAQGERTFRLEVPRGDYLVFAIPGDVPESRVGFTDCEGDATDAPCAHELKVVVVRAGETTEGIDPSDLRSRDEASDWPQPPPSD